jgi:hypothetical protein
MFSVGLGRVSACFLLIAVCREQIFGVAVADNGSEVLHFLDALSQTLLETIAEALAKRPAARKLDGQLLTAGRLPFHVWYAIPRCDGQCEHVALAV